MDGETSISFKLELEEEGIRTEQYNKENDG